MKNKILVGILILGILLISGCGEENTNQRRSNFTFKNNKSLSIAGRLQDKGGEDIITPTIFNFTIFDNKTGGNILYTTEMNLTPVCHDKYGFYGCGFWEVILETNIKNNTIGYLEMFINEEYMRILENE